MGWLERFVFAGFLIVVAAIDGCNGDAMVTGTVFCDQCKDGQVTLFDYPLQGIKVSLACPGSDGQLTTWREETTNWLGNYAIKIEGSPDLGGCYAQVSANGPGCGAIAGSAQNPKLMFQMFDMEFYTVNPLVSQPFEPNPFCPKSGFPSPTQTPMTPAKSPPRLPPLPQLPPMPPVPFLEASACPYKMWAMPEYKCYWKVVSPDSKVGVVFGLLAARRYGTDITLRIALHGRGDPYRTLLREATTALLNSYNSIQFPYHPLSVVGHTNAALMVSSPWHVNMVALRFMRANSGYGGRVACKFRPCN